MKKTFILKRNIEVPFVLTTSSPNKPPLIKKKAFRKGEMIQGELKHANNVPSFVLIGKTGVIPLECVEEVLSKPVGETTSSASGDTVKSADEKNKKAILAPATNNKVRYADAMLIGALTGFLGVYFAQKHGYIDAENKKYRLFGAVGVGLLAVYIVYRTQSNQVKKVVKPETKD